MIRSRNKNYIGILALLQTSSILLVFYLFVLYSSWIFPEKEATSSSAVVMDCRPLKNVEDSYLIKVCDAHKIIHYCKSHEPYSINQKVLIEYVDDKTDYKYTIIRSE